MFEIVFGNGYIRYDRAFPMPEKGEIRLDLGACGTCGNSRFQFLEEVGTTGGASLLVYTCTACGDGKTIDALDRPAEIT